MVVKDIISSLPDELLYHILSYVPVKEAVATSCLSSRWKDLYSNLHCFTMQLLPGPRNDQLLDYIDTKMFNLEPTHDICIRRFHLEEYNYPCDPVVRRYIERWVDLVAHINIEEMIVKFADMTKYCPQGILASKSIVVLSLTNCTLWLEGLDIDHVTLVSLKRLTLKNVVISECLIQKILATSLDLKAIIIELPYYHVKNCQHAILSSKYITMLSLTGCVLWETSLNIDNVELYSLKRLSLKRVVVSDCLIQKILAIGLNLEEVKLEYCEGLTCVKITGLNSLKTLKLRTERPLEWVEIDAPSLVRFSNWVHCLPNTCELRFTNCSNLRELTLIPLSETFYTLNRKIPILNNSKYLSIQSDYMNKQLPLAYISSGSIKSFLSHCDQLSKIEINIPSIQHPKLRSNKILSISFKTPPIETKITILYIREMGPKGYISLLNLLRELIASKKVAFHIDFKFPDILIPEEWKTHFACNEFLTQYQHLWLGKSIGLFDMVDIMFPDL